MTRREAVDALDRALTSYGIAFRGTTSSGIARSLAQGKAYELRSLAALLEMLNAHEGFQYQYHGGPTLRFRLGGGPIDPLFAHIDVMGPTGLIGKIWTDVQFVALSAHDLVCDPAGPVTTGCLHELDLAIVVPSASGYPCHEDIIVGVECKDSIFTNKLLKQVLGVRREMALLRPPQATGHFRSPDWSHVPTSPPSWLCVMCSSYTVLNYQAPGPYYGIKFFNV